VIGDEVGRKVRLKRAAQGGVAGDEPFFGTPTATSPGHAEAGEQSDPSQGVLRHQRKEK